MTTIARLAVAVITATLYVAMAMLGVAVARADVYCSTSYMSGMSFELCRYSDPWRPATTTTCWLTSYCTTKEG